MGPVTGSGAESFFSMPSLNPIWGRYIWARVRERTVCFRAGPAGMDRERPTLDMDLMVAMSEVEWSGCCPPRLCSWRRS